MSWVDKLKARVRKHFDDKAAARKNEQRLAESKKKVAGKKRMTAIGAIKQAGQDRDSSLEEALTPEELAKFGYKPRKKTK